MRRFPIRLRMQGAIGVVLALFALVGLTGLVGGRHLAELNTAFMHHALKEVRDSAASATRWARCGDRRRTWSSTTTTAWRC